MQENLQDKDAILLEISSLIKANEKELDIDLSVMKFLSIEELVNIKNSLLKRKINRKDERENWYNEWVQKCGK